MTINDIHAPIPPGEILLEEFLKPLDISAYRLAKQIRVPVNRVTAIIAGKRAITADTALRLARAFNTTPRFWLNMQLSYELELAQDAQERIAQEVEPLPMAAALVHDSR